MLPCYSAKVQIINVDHNN